MNINTLTHRFLFGSVAYACALHRRIRNYLRRRSFFVILDPADNSVTLSHALFNHMRRHANAAAPENGEESQSPKIFVFRVPEHHSFGFMLNPGITQPTQLCQIQYNGKYHCVGFESLCPSVGQMLYDYHLPHYFKCKLTVSVETTPNHRLYYLLHAPISSKQ